jgi:hypothetical protein
MIAARIARRDPIRFLLLTGIDVTNARPWIGFAGMAACWIVAVLLENAT